jgi:putative oligomerization/nucleic acid binding protein
MQQLTSVAEQALQSLAQRYGVSTDAVTTLLFAVSAGGGTMAQFYHPELGGGGQWMQGGMTMVGDMFNGRLQSTVSGLCAELSSLLSSQQVFLPAPASTGNGFMQSSNAWWPSELGQPSSSGGQNDTRYAYFPGARRLAVSRGGQVTVYDTLDHQIGGVQQQQGGAYGSQSFTSQFGTFTVESLPSVSQQAPQSFSQQAPQSSEPRSLEQPSWARPQVVAQGSGSGASHASPDILNAIERLGQLHERGILSDDEFRSKKAELLARL